MRELQTGMLTSILSISSTPDAEPLKRERRGPVLAVLQELLAEGRTTEVVALVAKLVSRNSELERLLRDAKSREKRNEGVSTAQLRLLLDGLAVNSDASLADVDARLRNSSGIDETRGEEEKLKTPRQPRLRRPIPTHLRCVENLIPVPADERSCPRCGVERVCIGHDVTEVIDLVRPKSSSGSTSARSWRVCRAKARWCARRWATRWWPAGGWAPPWWRRC